MNRHDQGSDRQTLPLRDHDQLRRHLATYPGLQFGRRLKTLKGLTPYEHICKCWTNEPESHPQSYPSNAGTKQLGLATFDPAEGELFTIDAVVTGQGLGTSLVEAVAAEVKAAGHSVLRVTTSNDNLDALRFYQRRGFI